MNDPCNRLAFPCLSRKLFAYQNTDGLRRPAVVSLTEMWMKDAGAGKTNSMPDEKRSLGSCWLGAQSAA